MDGAVACGCAYGQRGGLSRPDTQPELALQAVHLGAGLRGSIKALQNMMYNTRNMFNTAVSYICKL